MVAVQHGLGRHVARLPPAKAHRVVLWSMIGFCFTLLSIALPKVAVVALLIRLMSPSSIHRYLLWFLAGLCSLVLLGHVPIIWTLCNTNSGCWNANTFLAYSIFAGSESLGFNYNRARWLTQMISILGFCRHIPVCVPSGRPFQPQDEKGEESRHQPSTWDRVSVSRLIQNHPGSAGINFN